MIQNFRMSQNDPELLRMNQNDQNDPEWATHKKVNILLQLFYETANDILFWLILGLSG